MALADGSTALGSMPAAHPFGEAALFDESSSFQSV
jgi:hypothetical protein